IAINSTLLISSNTQQHIELKKRIDNDGAKGEIIWKDGFGEPVLIRENNTSLNHFHFYSRFNPQWTDLVWNEQFVKALVPLVLDTINHTDFGFEDHDADQRILAKEQIFISNGNTTSNLSNNTQQHLAKWIWVMAFIVLVIERIISLRSKTNLGYV